MQHIQGSDPLIKTLKYELALQIIKRIITFNNFNKIIIPKFDNERITLLYNVL